MAGLEICHSIWDSVRVEKWKPTGGSSVAHAFAKLMYDVCQILGVFREGSKQRDIRAYGSFWRHQAFFNQRYNEIIGIIDKERVFSEEERRSLFYKYEMFYNQIMSYPVFSTLTRSQVFERYIQLGVSSCLALDIHKTFNTTNNSGFYFHIHSFLLSDHCPTLENNGRDILQGVKNYLRDLIKSPDGSYKKVFSPLSEYIRNIRKKSTPIKTWMNSAIDECIEYSQTTLDEDEFNKIKGQLDDFKVAYSSLRVLLALERKIGLTEHLSSFYRTLYQVEGLNDSYYLALHQYLYESKNFDERLLKSVIEEFQKKATKPYSIEINEDTWLDIKVIWHLVFSSLKGDVFSELDLIELAINLKNSPDSVVLTPYLTLSKIIHNICIDDLNEANKKTNAMSINELPPGFISAAISTIKLALNIKLNGNTIKNGELLSDINTILTYRGVFTDHVNIDRKFKQPDLILVMCANNLIIMSAIKQYNNMVQMTSFYNELELSAIHPQSITGILDEVEFALGKINKRLDETEKAINSEELAKLIIDEKILTVRECRQNLVSYLNEFTLYNCILNLNYIKPYLTLPGEKLVHISGLVGNSEERVIKREFLAEAIRIVNERAGKIKPLAEGEKSQKMALIHDLSSKCFKNGE
ncbi:MULTISPECIES: hypothetical protein [Enterobacteriaceae]|uniref:hypothetical protein n=1 Tax=Enterobacteriaceae TaxID=543 RepID=UPI00126ABCD1|nr:MULTISPECIES: hypothetical protein [Enterobacteriaceae]ECF0178298.1 hypothetical protein [Salmonella enterica subsp. enterica serovar Newport]EKK5432670.1 hypothetical protein [Enterobacter hormaechei]EEG8339955.1 hypothetical protein [Salmonella enterica subsp. enterica serovar Newport]EIH2560408.1 hypothetical protein [Escherichia coli]MBS9598886.1 hypothetical protein [Escherichia coli]